MPFTIRDDTIRPTEERSKRESALQRTRGDFESARARERERERERERSRVVREREIKKTYWKSILEDKSCAVTERNFVERRRTLCCSSFPETFEDFRKERTEEGFLILLRLVSSACCYDVVDSRGGFLVPNDQSRRGGRPRSYQIKFRRVSASVVVVSGEKEKQETERV